MIKILKTAVCACSLSSFLANNGGVDAMVLPLPPASSTSTSGGNAIIISPSVAKADLLHLEDDLRAAVDGGAEWLHFSIQDGRMVPKISFGAPVVAACRKAFPHTILDVKLGCIEPEARIAEFVKAGADILTVHPEATLQLGAVINMIAINGVAPGVILNPGTPVSAVEPVLDQCQVAVVMLVNPGYGGPKYLEQAVEKIKALRALKPDLHISVDGGVNGQNAPELIAAGANVLVAGGGVFSAENKAAAIQELQNCGVTLAYETDVMSNNNNNNNNVNNGAHYVPMSSS